MLERKDIAEGAPYDHPEYGEVRVVLVDGSTVVFEQPDERLSMADSPPLHKERIEDFRRTVDPLPVSIAVPTRSIDIQTNIQ